MYNTFGRYLTLDDYNGALGGIKSMPAGNQDTTSPGGMSSIDHHWTLGMYGKGNRTYDVFFGTGDRYVSGIYGNLYQPGHSSIYELAGGPDTRKTDYTTLKGADYYWNNRFYPPPANPFI